VLVKDTGGNRLTSTKQKVQTTKLLLKRAEEFHGHIGPFLVMGVRMGQIGLKELDLGKHKNSLNISLKVLQKVPYSCIVDGIQISTGCTVGNRKLQLKNSEEIEAHFNDLSNRRSVTIMPHPTVLAMLKEQVIEKKPSEEEVCNLAWNVASMPEKALLIVRNR